MSEVDTTLGRSRRLTRKDAANYLRVEHAINHSPQTLARLASEGTGPLYRKAGKQAIYDVPDLDDYAKNKTSSRARSFAAHEERERVAHRSASGHVGSVQESACGDESVSRSDIARAAA